jgi:hypothetical protein
MWLNLTEYEEDVENEEEKQHEQWLNADWANHPYIQ